MARYAPFFLPENGKLRAESQKTHLKYGFFENKKSLATKMKRCAEFLLFL